MPHHPTEENAPDNLTDKVARESSSISTGDHPMHDENKGPIEHGQSSDKSKATTQDHAGKGPQISDNMPDVEGSKDELKAKAAQMNK